MVLTFGQLNKCQFLNGISAGIGVSELFISDLNLHQSPACSTMSDGNKRPDWQMFESLYYRLLSHYKSVLKKHHKAHVIKEIKDKSIKLIDSSIISLCLTINSCYSIVIKSYIIHTSSSVSRRWLLRFL